MLKTERMTRVLVLGTMDSLTETVDYLYDSRSFHIVDFRKDEVHDIGTPLPGADRASAKLLKMMSVSNSLELSPDDMPVTEKVHVDSINRELDAALSHLELEVSATLHSKKGVDALLHTKRAELAAIAPFSQLDFPLSLLSGSDHVTVYSGHVRGDPEAELKALTDACEVLRTGDVFILVISSAFSDAAMKILASHGFTEVRIPAISETPRAASERLSGEIRSLEARAADAEGRLEKLRKGNSQFIAAALEELTISANKAETPLQFGTARFTFIIDAWVPTKSVDALRAGLAKIDSGSVDMLPVQQEQADSPPILLNNSKAVAPMEMLLEMFSLPSYNEIDPAAFMFITFPLFYGLMLGDIGYGIVIMLLVLTGGLKKLMTKLGMAGGAPGLSKILLYCSITSIIFGFLFDETFGFEIMHHYGIHFEILGIHFPVVRMEALGPMLILCIWIGVAHLMLGYIAGFRNVWVQHGLKHAILEKGGWCLILAGLTLFAFSIVPAMISGAGLQFTDPQAVAGLVIMFMGVGMAFAVEGINTVLELPGLTGNLLSYTRIYAIGLSSVGIALAFNEYMAVPAIEAGGIGIIIGVLVLVAGHALNIGLGIIGPLIQTLRLHYVEFFTKFYKGGGIKFNPLRYNRKHTKEV
ncbi:MAG: V-type ATP synthase subunit I [Thermoplasmata archaeon]|nr:V-type ATP synthase subunit I [Thermoplasmata archaeon]